MNLQVEMRKMIDWLNSQEPVIRLLLWVFVLLFIIIPFGLPLAIVYFLWVAWKGREHSQ